MKREKKLKYPEFINGVKQIQNPIARWCTERWYSWSFRLFAIYLPIWQWQVVDYFYTKYEMTDSTILWAMFYGIPFFLARVFNNFSNLRRVGLDEFGKPLKEKIN